MIEEYKEPNPPVITRGDIKKMIIEAKIIRANGSVEDYGVVSIYHKNKLRNLLAQVYVRIHRLITERNIGKYSSKHR
jgi:hypothetical protein